MLVRHFFVKTKDGKWVNNDNRSLRSHDIIEPKEVIIEIPVDTLNNKDYQIKLMSIRINEKIENENQLCKVVPVGGFGHWGISEYCMHCPASDECEKLTSKIKNL